MKPNYRIYDRTGGGVTEDIYADSLEEALQKGRAWIEAGDWSGCEGQGCYQTIQLECEIGPIIYGEDGQDGQIDEDATDEADRHDCSGTYSSPEPECEAKAEAATDDDVSEGGHVWETPHELVGGLRENPGVWSTGGTAWEFAYVCKYCGCHKRTRELGSQRHPGQPIETYEILPPNLP